MSRSRLLAGLSTAAILTALAAPACAQASVTPVRASTLVGSFGVNTHLGWWDTSWGVGNGQWAGAESKVISEMNYLGIYNIRDSVPQGGAIAEYADLGKAGFRFDLIQNNSNGTVTLNQDISTIASMQLGYIIAYEGSNEYNANSYTLNGQSSKGNLPWGTLDDQVSSSTLHATATLGSIPFFAASTASSNSAPVVTPYVAASNWHCYGGIGEQLKANLAGCIANAKATAPGKPVVITEAGISSANVSGQTWGTAGDELTQGVIDVNALLDSFNQGASITDIYDLMDTQKAADLEDNFGLFNTDGTPKAVATDIHDLTSIMADAGSTANSFTPYAIPLTVSGLPSTASSLLLQKSDGTYELLLWNGGANVWSGTAEVAVTPVPVTVGFGNTYTNVKTYDPMISATAQQTLSKVSGLTVSLAKDPIVIEFSGVYVAPAPVPAPAPVAKDTITISASEDAYNGDAQFNVKVDGTQVTGTLSVTASHAAGASQDFVLTGSWGTGAHTIDVDFTNDAYGGSASKDRNMYVSKVVYDGVTSSNTNAQLLSNGGALFSIPASK